MTAEIHHLNPDLNYYLDEALETYAACLGLYSSEISQDEQLAVKLASHRAIKAFLGHLETEFRRLKERVGEKK